MSHSNGALITRPASFNRIARIVTVAQASARAESEREEADAAYRDEAQQRDDRLRAKLGQMAQAQERYNAAVKAVRQLHEEQRRKAPSGTAAEQAMRQAVFADQVDAHRTAMIAAVEPVIGPDAAKRAVDADLRKVAADSEERPKPLRSGDILPEQD